MMVLTPASVMGQGPDYRPGDRAPFSGIVCFGDSLSDTGNLFALTGYPPGPAYFEGRFSNGPVWIEYLAAHMGVPADRFHNYAYGGATTGRENYNDLFIPPGGLPGVLDQIDAFEADLDGRRADRRALYVVFAGSNDLFLATDPIQAAQQAMGNTATAVQRLYAAGARRVLVVGLPDLGITPWGLATGQAALSGLSAAYNASLDFTLAQLAAAGMETMRLDIATIAQQAAADPAAFGFVDVTTPALYFGSNGDGFLYWDEVHPTTQGHAVFAESAMAVLRQRYPKVWATPVGRR